MEDRAELGLLLKRLPSPKKFRLIVKMDHFVLRVA